MNPEVHKKIDSISFEVISPKMMIEAAAAKIVTPELYDKEGYPVDGGLMDLRLGVIDPGLICKTDGLKLKESLGHFGYIELARPVVHIKFVRQILDLLRSTCKACGRVLIPEEKVKKYVAILNKESETEDLETRRRKVKEIVSKYKAKDKCPHCNAKQEKIKIEKPYNFYEGEARLSPIEVRARLEKILEEDDLTHKLGDIVRINQRLFENINAGAPEVIIEDLWDLLQYHVTTFFDNEVPQLPPARHRGGQTLKTLTDRIKSKEGRIRHNLAGKRTDFYARTVISPDPKIGFDEVGVPLRISMNLTVPERVTEWNKEYLRKFVENGSKKYPGANYVLKQDGKRKTITTETKDEILQELAVGYTVERHLLDGDIALFNRQPSLHRMSMMCHKVKVLPGKTFRLNP